jgi:hypothetical protein
MKTAKVAPKAEPTFDVDGTGTDGREGSEEKSSSESETSGQSYEPASNNVNVGQMSASCEQIDQDSLQEFCTEWTRNLLLHAGILHAMGKRVKSTFYMLFCFDLNYRANERNFRHGLKCRSELIRNNSRLHFLPTFACSIVSK